MNPQPAPRNLTALADAINELVDPSHHTERYQLDHHPGTAGTAGTITTRRGRVTARKITRQQTITTTIPALLDALRHACIPPVDTNHTGATGGAFESRPPLAVEPVAVYRAIRDDTLRWARHLGVGTRQPLPAILRNLVSATTTDDQFGNLLADARRWVRDARLAVGYDAAPITVETSCPICSSRNAIVVHGVGLGEERQHAKCSRCKTAWSPDQLGLLAEMLRANREQTTMIPDTDAPSVSLDGDHTTEHDQASFTLPETPSPPSH